MKKIVALVLALMMGLLCVAVAEDAVMTYADFTAAEVDDLVTVEAYVQSAAYNAAYGNVTMFLADADGAYYLYRYPCDDALAAQLTVGTKVLVKGYKAEWAGEVEIDGTKDAELTVEEGTWVAEAKDVTAELGTDSLIEKMNQLVAVTGAEVVAYNDNGDAFSYAWDGSGAAGANSDLYFRVSVNGQTFDFTVESDEVAEGTDTYTAVTNLKVGDVVDLEGFLYWYNGAQLHVNKVTVK